MDFSNENLFKQQLKERWSRIYSGQLLVNLSKWIEEGSLESEYYSAPFDDLRDTKVVSLTQWNKHHSLRARESEARARSPR